MPLNLAFAILIESAGAGPVLEAQLEGLPAPDQAEIPAPQPHALPTAAPAKRPAPKPQPISILALPSGELSMRPAALLRSKIRAINARVISVKFKRRAPNFQ